ncbi:filamin-A isoform X1 [Hydra vulgaris]|uniref:Filamin-A isoform X1 n=2 Tax=Hydra vulgaris TaxID=6087 RepID=A0ABM4B5X9_HYDVU
MENVTKKAVVGSEEDWIEMQNNTFTNWVNANLKQRGMSVESIAFGFEDGVKLVNLYEIVAKRSLGKYAKNPKFPNQKLENVSLVLKAMQQDGVKLVSIDSDHVVNCNFKMILGLIWQLILRYQISGTEDKSIKIALKKLLLVWLQHVIPEQNITNLTNDWNNGIALCNLINVLHPGSFPEYNHLRQEDAFSNACRGMKLAEDMFNIPQIISAENMINKNVDELSMITYLSYFTKDNGIGVLWTLNLVNKWNSSIGVKNFNKDWNDGSAIRNLINTFQPNLVPEPISIDNEENCKIAMAIAEKIFLIPQIISPTEMANPKIPELAIMAYVVQFTKVKPIIIPSTKFSLSGAGIVEPKVGAINEFYIRCSDDTLEMDGLEVEIIGPNLVPINFKYDINNPLLRTYKYNAEEQGIYRISVMYQGNHVPQSPVITIAKQDLEIVKVRGEGLSGGHLHSPVIFIVDVGAANSQVEVNIEGPDGKPVKNVVKNNEDGTYTVKYTPLVEGIHLIDLTVNKQKLPGGPIKTMITDLGSVTVTTKQYEIDRQLYAELHERIGIAVDTSSSGVGTLTAETKGPNKKPVETDIENDGNDSYTVSFTPNIVGEYYTNVYWNGKNIQGCPFVVWVSDCTKVKTCGEPLKYTNIHEETFFNITTFGAGPGNLTGYIEKEGFQIPLNISMKDINTYACSFRANEVGEHNVCIYYNNVSIHGNPHKVNVCNPKKVVVVKGTDSNVLLLNQPHSLEIELGVGAGFGELSCSVIGPVGEIPSSIKELTYNRREIRFVPVIPGSYEVKVFYCQRLITGSPYTFKVYPIVPEHLLNEKEENQNSKVDPSKVTISTSFLEAIVDEPSRLTVNPKYAGPGHLSATFQGENNTNIVVGIRDNNNGTYEVTYTPPSSGKYVLNLYWDDQHIPGSPFNVVARKKEEEEKFILKGNGIREGTAGQPVLFTLDGRRAGHGKLSCKCRAPSGKMTYVLISDNKDGTYTVDLNATEPGLHTVEVEWDNRPITGSPFLVRIMQATDAKKVKARGPGLESGILANFQGNFKVDSKGAGPGTLKIRIHGPKGAFKVEMFRESDHDRLVTVRYNPTERGIYTANVFWSDEHITGSPFEIFVAENEKELRLWKENKEHVQKQADAKKQQNLLTTG